MAKAIREVVVTNTLSGKKEKLETLQPGNLTMYSCGPTVYGLIHVGNLRTAIVSDMLFRYFGSIGYEVNYVRNYTDIDDRIIEQSQKDKTPWDEIAKKFIGEAERDYAAAGMLEPTHKTLATEHVKEMHEMIQKIIDAGKAYEVDGEVFFDVNAFPGYGKLSHKNTEELIAGARVEVNPKKRNPLDFALWKAAKEGEPTWESPWGKGRPGWHIECSAMSSRWLGDQIDIHHGATDLIFTHHENEIAQSEAASGKDPFVKYWLHNGLLNIGNKKMSKSLGNFVKAREFLTRYGGEFTRYFFLGVHYRAPMDFTEEAVEQALQSLARIYEAKKEAEKFTQMKAAMPDPQGETVWGEFVADCEKASREIDEHFANDLNTAGALGSLFIIIRKFNKNLKTAASTPAAVLGAQRLIQLMEQDLGNVFGLFKHRAEKVLEDIQKIRTQNQGEDALSDEEIQKLIGERKAARAAKDFKRSDEIRDELAAKGVVLKDGPSGTTFYRQ